MASQTTRGHDPSQALAAALVSTAELPSGARRVLDRVFWGVGSRSARGACVVPFPRVLNGRTQTREA